jgi:hypothetical protein
MPLTQQNQVFGDDDEINSLRNDEKTFSGNLDPHPDGRSFDKDRNRTMRFRRALLRTSKSPSSSTRAIGF